MDLNQFISNSDPGFQSIAKLILHGLDDSTLGHCRLVCTNWHDFLTEEWKRRKRRFWLKLQKEAYEEIPESMMRRVNLQDFERLDLNTLYMACREGLVNLVKFLLHLHLDEQCQMIDIVNVTDPSGIPPFQRIFNSNLSNLVYKGTDSYFYRIVDFRLQLSIAIVEQFLRHPQRHAIDFNIRDTVGRTPLYLACQLGNNAVVKLFLKSFDEKAIGLNVGDYIGRTPLHIACIHGHKNIVKLLFDHPQTKVIGLESMTTNGKPLILKQDFGPQKILDLLDQLFEN